MCMAVPGQVISINGKNASVNMLGIKREVVVSHLKGIKKGDHVLVFRDFAIEKLTKGKADQIAREIKDI